MPSRAISNSECILILNDFITQKFTDSDLAAEVSSIDTRVLGKKRNPLLTTTRFSRNFEKESQN